MGGCCEGDNVKSILTEQEISAFRQLNIEQMKRDEDNLNRAKWLVIGVVVFCAAVIVYCGRFV